MNLKRYLLIAAVLLAFDWTLGVLQAHGVIPAWSFLILNFPFGIPFVWLESLWVGTRYQLGNHIIGELWSLAAFLFAVLAQASLYCLLLAYCQNRRPASHA